VPAADATPFEAVFDAYVHNVWRVLRRLGVQEDDIEDVTQEVFLVVHRRLAGLENRARLRTWVYGISRRCAAAYRRRAHRRREVPMATPPETRGSPSQEGDVDRRRALALLDAVLAELPDAQRETYVLFEVEELPMTEVAAAMECPLKTAYARLYAARKTIRAVLRARDRSVA